MIVLFEACRTPAGHDRRAEEQHDAWAFSPAGGDVRARSSPPPATQSPRALTVTYSDGRTVPRLLTPYGATWTLRFPHRPDAPTQSGVPLSGLKVEHRVEADVVVVTVSLSYGQPSQRVVPVATIRLRDDNLVPVRELSAFGVDPITLALATPRSALIVVPYVSSASAMVEANVEPTSTDLPLYQITFQNHSTKPIAAIAYHAYRGDTSVLVGTRSHNRSLPVLEPGARLQFTIQAARNNGPQGFDRFEVTGVLWEDGTVEGDPGLKDREHALALGRAHQLGRVLALLRKNTSASAEEIRSAVEKLPVKLTSAEANALMASSVNALNLPSVEAGQSYVRTAALDDLQAYIQSHSADPIGANQRQIVRVLVEVRKHRAGDPRSFGNALRIAVPQDLEVGELGVRVVDEFFISLQLSVQLLDAPLRRFLFTRMPRPSGVVHRGRSSGSGWPGKIQLNCGLMTSGSLPGVDARTAYTMTFGSGSGEQPSLLSAKSFPGIASRRPP